MDRLMMAIVAVLLYLASGFSGSFSCPVQQGLTVTKLNQILDRAKECSGTGTMRLGGCCRGPSSRKYPISEWPPNTEILQAPEGGTLLIHCNNSLNTNGTQVSHIAIPPAIAYNGLQVALDSGGVSGDHKLPSDEKDTRCNCTESASGYIIPLSWRQFDYSSLTGAFTIALKNFTYAYTGLYECLHSNGSQRVVTQRYWLSATLLRHEVFSPPMKNVTVRYGDSAEMVCPVRFNFLPGGLMTRFIWRKESSLLIAKSIPEVADKIWQPYGVTGHYEFGAGRVDEMCRCNSTFKIDSATWHHAGRYECWFRINDRLDEWVVQEAYLHVV
ncbi:uncharacterized protein LOC129591451 [Paramacrobiotus metropolitanus]|uniref:uncharacterized protein LOC129591451 n=1 Tax=Paramacrobiotus metropolitanus TaxID=2943436 RepID=UPI00244597C0|nr:uncharacterized protein LOC129591451 [Paramacrobiotus metropolitanus]